MRKQIKNVVRLLAACLGTASMMAHGALVAHYGFEPGTVSYSGNATDGFIYQNLSGVAGPNFYGKSTLGIETNVFWTSDAVAITNLNDHLEWGNSGNYEVGSHWSFALWYQSDGTDTDGYIFDTSRFQRFTMGREIGGSEIKIYDGTWRGAGNVPASEVFDGDWHHWGFTVVSNGASSAECKLYIDGVLRETFVSGLTPRLFLGDQTGFGNRYAPTGTEVYVAKGLYDDIRVYNEVLDAAAIAELAIEVPFPTVGVSFDDITHEMGNGIYATLPKGYRSHAVSDTTGNSVPEYIPFATGDQGFSLDTLGGSGTIARSTRHSSAYGQITTLDGSGLHTNGYNTVMNSVIVADHDGDVVQINLSDLEPGPYEIKIWLHSVYAAGGAGTDGGSWNIAHNGTTVATGVPGKVGVNLGTHLGNNPQSLADIGCKTLVFTVGDLGTATFQLTRVTPSSDGHAHINGFELTRIRPKLMIIIR